MRPHVDREIGDAARRDGGDELLRLRARLADEQRASSEAAQADGRFLAVAGQRRAPGMPLPFQHAVKMVVGPESAPELGDLVVMQAKEGDADGSAGKSA